jgi:hypothetical protein
MPTNSLLDRILRKNQDAASAAASPHKANSAANQSAGPDKRPRDVGAIPLCELLPIRDFPEGANVMVRTDGCYVAGYKLRGARTFFSDTGRRNEVNLALDAMLRTLPEESMRVQFRYEITEDAKDIIDSYIAYSKTTSPHAQILDAERIKMWREQNTAGAFLSRHIEVYFIWDPDVYMRRSGKAPTTKQTFSVSQKKNTQILREQFEAFLSQFNAILEGAYSSLSSAGLQPVRMTGDELFEAIAKALSPMNRRLPRLQKQKPWGRYVSAREMLANSTIPGCTDEYIVNDRLLWSFISMKTPPDETYPGVMRDLMTLGLPLVISTQICVKDQQEVLKRYQTRQKRMINAQNDGRGGRRVDVSASVAESELEETQAKIMSSSTKACTVSVCIGVRTSEPIPVSSAYDDEERELATRCQKVLHALSTVGGATGLQESSAQVRIMVNTLPGLAHPDDRERDMLSSHAADLCPVELPWEGTVASPLILLPTPYRQLIPYSPFDPSIENANGLVVATSGSGKSVTMSMLLMSAARHDPRVCIIESGDSYEYLVRYMGGQMITMSLESEQVINPFDLEPGESMPSREHESFLVNLLRYMTGESSNVDADILDQVLTKSIRDAYARAEGSTQPIPTLRAVYSSLLFYVDERSQISVDAARLAAAKLEKWVNDGVYAKLFDRETTVPMTSPWLYFNISKLKDDPRVERAMSLTIAHATTKRAYGMKHVQSYTVVDEGWAALESPALARTFEVLTRTARKANGCIWFISQAVEDFTGTPENPKTYGPAILATTATRFYGRQRGNVEVLRDSMHLTETAIHGIQTLPMTSKGRYSEWVFAIGENPEMTHKAWFRPTPTEYWITTTFPRERYYREWFIGTNPKLTLQQAIGLLGQRFPLGLSDLAELPEEKSGQVMRFITQGKTQILEEQEA